MDFDLSDDHRMVKDLVERFVRDELLPLEAGVLAREAAGADPALLPADRARLDALSKDLGLWSLDAPVADGGSGLPHVALVAVNEALGSTVATYVLPPDSPNLRMLAATVDDRQRAAYLAPYARGETVSAIGISEPGAAVADGRIEAPQAQLLRQRIEPGAVGGQQCRVGARRFAGQNACFQRQQFVADKAFD